MTINLGVEFGGVALKNPLICGAGEHLMEAAGIKRAIAAGAGAVVIKSTNESTDARAQLIKSEYGLFDSSWNRLSREGPHLPDVSLFCRSGLAQQTFDEWLDLVCRMDLLAARNNAYVVASLIPADIDQTIQYALRVEKAGVRILEVNIGAPHGSEAMPGAIMLERDEDRVEQISRAIKQAVKIPVWIKLTGQAQNLPQLAMAAKRGGADAVGLMGRLMGFLPNIETMKPWLNTHAAFGGGWALPLTCHWLVKTRQLVGKECSLIGTNGARNGLDIVRFMLSGARAVQLTSVVMVEGFEVITKALAELENYLEHKGLNAHDIVGVTADQVQTYGEQKFAPGNWRSFVPKESLD